MSKFDLFCGFYFLLIVRATPRLTAPQAVSVPHSILAGTSDPNVQFIVKNSTRKQNVGRGSHNSHNSHNSHSSHSSATNHNQHNQHNQYEPPLRTMVHKRPGPPQSPLPAVNWNVRQQRRSQQTNVWNGSDMVNTLRPRNAIISHTKTTDEKFKTELCRAWYVTIQYTKC